MKAKRCSRCGVTKETVDFYRHRGEKDGFQRFCKACHIEANRKSRLLHSEANRARMRLYLERYEAEERDRKAEWRRRNREKYLAQKAVYRAVRSGRLQRPPVCSRCGTDRFRIEAHHEDYARRLDVVWLCSPCHGQRQLELKAVAA